MCSSDLTLQQRFGNKFWIFLIAGLAVGAFLLWQAWTKWVRPALQRSGVLPATCDAKRLTDKTDRKRRLTDRSDTEAPPAARTRTEAPDTTVDPNFTLVEDLDL